MRKHIKFLITIVLLFIVLLVLLGVLTSGTSPGMTEAGARALAGAIISEVPGSHRGLVYEPDTNMAMTLHVDMSSSMAGYVFAEGTYQHVIEYLARQWTPRLHAVGSKYAAENEYVDDPRFYFQQTNYYGGHDMALTIDGFGKDAGRMHLLVTDSQPWDAGNSPAYEKIAGAINDFLSLGGRCVLLLYRSAYRGHYPSPMFGSQANNQVFYDCTNRPFAVWLFAHAGIALDRVVEDLSKQTGDLRWASKVHLGEPDICMALAGRTLPGVGSSKMGQEIGTVSLVGTGVEKGRIREYQRIQIRKKALNPQGYVPLQIDLAPFGKQLTQNEWPMLQNGVRVTLDCWAVPEEILKGGNGEPPTNKTAKVSSTAKAPVSTNAPMASLNLAGTSFLQLAKQLHMDLEHELLFITNAPSTNATGVVTPGSVIPRLVVDVPRPGQGQCYAWVLTLRREFTGGLQLAPRGFSSPDDRDPSHCERILRLDEMLNIVAAKTEKLGCTLFLTDYPK